MLEGYAWPGNISELQDVLRYVAARKPVGEIQPPDLPVNQAGVMTTFSAEFAAAFLNTS